MPRILSTFFTQFFADKATLDERFYNSHSAMQIKLNTGAKINVADGEFTMTSLSQRGASVALDEPIFFEGKLLAAPEIQFTQGDASDGSTGVTISNLDYLLSGLMVDSNRIFDGAKVTAYVCLKKADGTYEGLIYAYGNVRVNQGDDEKAQVDFVSDMSDRNVTAGGHEITQKCLNELGVISNRSFCPATNLPDGAKCSKVKTDKAGGCAFWNQEPYFQGVSFFNPNAVPNYPQTGSGALLNNGTGGGDFGGWTEPRYLGGGDCPDVESFIKTPSGWKKGKFLKAGDVVIDHLDRVSLVEKIEVKFSQYRYLIESPSGARGIFSANHPVLTSFDDETGTSLMALLPSVDPNKISKRNLILKRQQVLGIYNPADQTDELKIVEFAGGVSRLTKFSFRLAAPGEVLKISLKAPHIYLAGLRIGAGFGGHNIKPMYSGLEVWSV